MNNQELYEKIERYLKNLLSPPERRAFETEMASDPSLAEEVALHRDMMEAVPEKDLFDLRQLMEASYQEHLENQGKKSESGWSFRLGSGGMRMAAAASVLLVAAVGVWWLQRAPETQSYARRDLSASLADSLRDAPLSAADTLSSGSIAANGSGAGAYADIPNTPKGSPPSTSAPPSKPKDTKPTPSSTTSYASIALNIYTESPYAPGTLMGNGEEPQEGSALQKATEAYGKNQFNEAVRLLQSLPEENHTEALIMRAHSLFRLRRFDLAASDFQALTRSLMYRNDAEWYLLLCHAARLPKTKLAYDTLLVKVSAPGHPFSQKVKELKAKINAFN